MPGRLPAALWGSASLRFTKFLILVDADVDVHDVRRVLAEAGPTSRPNATCSRTTAPAHASDQANTMGVLGRHLGIDATTKMAGERSVGTAAASGGRSKTRSAGDGSLEPIRPGPAAV